MNINTNQIEEIFKRKKIQPGISFENHLYYTYIFGQIWNDISLSQ